MRSKRNPTSSSAAIRVGLTIGDPAGIGPVIALKALRQLKGKARVTLIGSGFVLAKAGRLLKIRPLAADLVDLDNIKPGRFSFGRINAECGKASLEYLDTALELLKNDQLDCLVTCPVSKEAVNLAGIKFSGHTEYLGERTGGSVPAMMLINKKLKFILATRHIPLKDVCSRLTAGALRDNILAAVKGLNSLFLIAKPRLVVCGLNPHASDNGLIGTEEKKLIIPAIKKLRKEIRGALIEDPLPADTAISQAAKGKFDCVVALYHDQALIPLKLTDFDSGVNLTLGLPFVRTSPLHGTAFDIAHKPALANPNSLIAAINLAVKCALNQKKD
ncbi:MAG: 4-hydroxythreonine-4-phosphate dehydrogenase PdxA [Candidatus Omnitrophica bacterium]|nr:4-hydroxythreonine-4-phosphate dehydrogenase PdxA [Candidatus Omnitrophota bacterium]